MAIALAEVPLPGPEFKPFQDIVHRRFSFCSPFRLGIAVGEAGADLPNPYTIASRAANSYEAGVKVGRERVTGGAR